MTHANTFAAKLSVAFVATAMLFTLAAPAKAQTTEELQKMINDLLAQVASLQGQVGQGGTSVASGICPFTWTRSLSSGSTGADVMKLQQFLNADAETRVAASGAGSVGMETQFFGPATAAAVSKFQTKYRADILTPAGLVNPTGYFGPSSMAKANAICVTGTTPTTPGDDDDDDDDSSVTLKGEASLDSAELNEGEDTEIEEGQEAAPVAEFEVEFSDGDAMITRIDVNLSGGSEDAWDTFEEVSLWVDGDEVATKAADDEDDYLSDEETLRFTGLDLVAMEDEPLTIVIAVTVQNGVDSLPDTWDLDITGMRFIDAEDVNTTVSGTELADDYDVEAIDFTIDEAGMDDEVIVKSSEDDPDATTLQLDSSNRSDWMTIFAFDLDTDDSTNDIDLETIVVEVEVSSSTYNALVNKARLVIDGKTFNVKASDVANGNTDTATLTLDIDGDVTIDAGDRVTAELEIEFKALADGDQGTTIQASVDGTDIEAEGADGFDGEGSATGEEHSLRTSGAILDLTSTTQTIKTNDADDVTDDEGVFTLKFDVTAFEQDLFIAKTATRGTSLGTAGVNYTVEQANGAATTTGTEAASLSSSAKVVGNYFKVSEGETKSFTLTVNYDPANRGFYQVQLYGINFNDTEAAADQHQLATPAQNFESEAQLSI